jgi:hypothetical protein
MHNARIFSISSDFRVWNFVLIILSKFSYCEARYYDIPKLYVLVLVVHSNPRLPIPYYGLWKCANSWEWLAPVRMAKSSRKSLICWILPCCKGFLKQANKYILNKTEAKTTWHEQDALKKIPTNEATSQPLKRRWWKP